MILFFSLQTDSQAVRDFTLAASQIFQTDYSKQTCALFPKTDLWSNSLWTYVVPLLQKLEGRNVCTDRGTQVPAPSSSWQTPSAHRGRFSKRFHVVKTGDVGNIADAAWSVISGILNSGNIIKEIIFSLCCVFIYTT